MRKYSGLCRIEKVTSLTSKIFSIEIYCPAITEICLPGQFLQLKIPGCKTSNWPRPFSIHKAENGIVTLSIKKLGVITNLLEKKQPGENLFVTGPLGNSFTIPQSGQDIYFIAGGVGLPPLHFFCRRLLDMGYPGKNIHFYSGAKTKDELFGDREMIAMGIDYVAATDDGSFGVKGFVTEPLSVELAGRKTGAAAFDPIVYSCGPTVMLKKVSEICHNIPCYVSLEQLMPCGWGVCNGCAVKLKNSGDIETEDKRDYRLARVCKEGPVFDAAEVLWD